MLEVEPKVWLIQEPNVVIGQLAEYLAEVGGWRWYERVVAPVVAKTGGAGATELIEFCGRLCYRSWEAGLNKNVTKIRENTAEYLLNILTSGHGSVIQHGHFTFVLHDVSRVVTAELNRHSHPDVSEQSLRYVRLDELRFRIPPGLPHEVERAGRQLVQETEHFLRWAAECCGLDNEGDEADIGLSFYEKKQITSALRRFAPMGVATEEVWTANLRDLRHIIESRTDIHAEEEIRVVVNQIAEIMAARAPFFFGDYERELHPGHKVPAWVTPYRKV